MLAYANKIFNRHTSWQLSLIFGITVVTSCFCHQSRQLNLISDSIKSKFVQTSFDLSCGPDKVVKEFFTCLNRVQKSLALGHPFVTLCFYIQIYFRATASTIAHTNPHTHTSTVTMATNGSAGTAKVPPEHQQQVATLHTEHSSHDGNVVQKGIALHKHISRKFIGPNGVFTKFLITIDLTFLMIFVIGLL